MTRVPRYSHISLILADRRGLTKVPSLTGNPCQSTLLPPPANKLLGQSINYASSSTSIPRSTFQESMPSFIFPANLTDTAAEIMGVQCNSSAISLDNITICSFQTRERDLISLQCIPCIRGLGNNKYCTKQLHPEWRSLPRLSSSVPVQNATTR